MSRPYSGGAARARLAPKVAATAVVEVGAQASDLSWRNHFAWLTAALRRRFGAELADDIAQETYVRLCDHPSGPAVKHPRGWLMTVALNLARDTYRRDRVRADHAAHAPERLLPPGLPGRTAEDDLLVREVILSLPPNLREVLLLSKIGGLTNREIAQRYGLSVRAIDKRLQKAILLFVARLRE
ncbi:MAG: sigma-70 family RNA polymerase sigma factor [Caulobacteraceae bacterium]|nr:sigma-70 family RNA polymerase sigma factor [Caulobacteraceae bacterium]